MGVADANLVGWFLDIASVGAVQRRRVVASSVSEGAGELTVDAPFDPSLPATGVRYILQPRFLNPVSVYFEGSGLLSVGYTPDRLVPGVTGYSREVVPGETATPRVVVLSRLATGSSMFIPIYQVGDLFYQYLTPAAGNMVGWGEMSMV